MCRKLLDYFSFRLSVPAEALPGLATPAVAAPTIPPDSAAPLGYLRLSPVGVRPKPLPCEPLPVVVARAPPWACSPAAHHCCSWPRRAVGPPPSPTGASGETSPVQTPAIRPAHLAAPETSAHPRRPAYRHGP